MAPNQTVGERIVALIEAMPGCQIEDLVRVAGDLSWNQIFSEIDYLSRSGRVLVTLKGRGEYMLSLPPQGIPEPYPRCDIAPAGAEPPTRDEATLREGAA